MADNITYRFIQNVGDYFPSGYFTDDFIDKVQKCAGRSSDEMKELCTPFVRLRQEYEDYKNFIVNANPRVKDAIERTHRWHTSLLKVLGYDTEHAYQEPYVVAEKEDFTEMIPVRHILRSGDSISMLIMEMQHLISVDDNQPAGLFEQQYDDGNTSGQQRYWAGQWSAVIPAKFLDKEHYRFCPAIINKAVTQIFLMPEERRPHFVLMLAGNTVFLFDKDKWARGSYLQFSLDDLYTQAQIKNFRLHYALFHLLICKDTLSADGQTVLMDTLIEESYKNAYEVTKDLKEGVILAVETLANEALYYMQHVAHRPFGKKKKREDGTEWYDETDDDFEAEVKDDCLTIVYRLLFILFAESRPELEILPTGDEVYKLGYSFEALRDLEQVCLVSQESRDGYFFDRSIHHLFRVLSAGYHPDMVEDRSFSVRPIDSPMFNDRRLKQLQDVRIRNVKWRQIVRALSLSRGKKYSGRISYANLGVNQLGSVYESLLAYRGFYAEEDYIEVHKAGDPSDGTFLVPYSRMSAFSLDEVLTDPETGEPLKLDKGTFVYRLNGRDRQKSASYYTPEVLTKSTVKYTIKAIVDEVRQGKRKAADLLDLKILEPAVGAAAFLNEAINQLAEAYMTYVPKKPSPDHYRDELQKVKAYIATHNVYGVDLNPTAIELGKLSLWLNVIHKDMETPFFANRLTVGNAVIGAWLKVYSRQDVVARVVNYRKKEATAWWEKAPHKVKFYQNRVNRSVNDVYHFLLPDKNMLGVLSIKEQKKAHPTEATRMQAMLKDWTKPISADDFVTLQRISAKIDVLLREAMETQVNIERLTNNKKDIWPHEVQGDVLFRDYMQREAFAEKERIFDTRNRHDNAYYKLRLVMDYWCALWFWEYDDAASLPNREEYWKEIETLLDISDDRLDANTRRAIERAANGMLQEELPLDYGSQRMTEEEAGIVEMSKEQLLLGTTAQLSLFVEEEPERFKIVHRLAKRYHFFHPMLEFIEVFWLRDGFDIILGNPPFLKWQFEPQDVLAEKYPELSIREDDYDAAYVKNHLEEYLADSCMKEIYVSEQTETFCCKDFLNAPSLYKQLSGAQSDLFKSVLLNSTQMMNGLGRMGMIHPDTVYTENKGEPLREYLYPILCARYHYSNKKKLFADVHGKKIFDCCIYRGTPEKISFDSISNLYMPNTVDACYAHDGHGECKGLEYVDESGKKHINMDGHKTRIVHYDEAMLRLIGQTFQDTDEWQSCKLVSIFTNTTLDILSKISKVGHLGDANPFVTEGLNATNSLKDNTMKRDNKHADYDAYDMIYHSAQVFILSPFNKHPHTVCTGADSQFDYIDYNILPIDYVPKTIYTPKTDIISFKANIDATGKWFERYKIAFKKMLDPTHERTLKGGIIAPKASHTHSLISLSFSNVRDLIQFAGLSASVVLDYFMKVVGVRNLTSSIVNGLPFGLKQKYYDAIAIRVLRLNCANIWFKGLWESQFDEKFQKETWGVDDSRLSSYSTLSISYNESVLLRSEFERRMAMIEIDVLVAMAMGLTLDDLLFIYTSTFSTTQKYDADTWYDKNGRVVFSVSSEYDLKIDRKQWEAMRGDLSDDGMTYSGTDATYVHTIDPKKSELYGGQQVTYYAPYNRMDRIEDYRRAWAHFADLLNEGN